MSILKRKKHNNGLDTFIDENAITIQPYAPHQNLSPVDYSETRSMSALKQSFECQVRNFLDKTSPDAYNGSFADSLIQKAKEQAIIELEVQRAEHKRCIERSISALWKGDEVFYERLLKQYDAEYEKRENELARLKAIYMNNTALSESVERGVN